MFQAGESDVGQMEDSVTPDSGRSVGSQSTLGSPSQRLYESSQESQQNASDPVCPELTDCELAVEKVLPQLTSSMW